MSAGAAPLPSAPPNAAIAASSAPIPWRDSFRAGRTASVLPMWRQSAAIHERP